MKPQLQIVKPALGGPQATTPTARMTKISDNRLWAYGGAFCISTPFVSPLECGFAPAKIEKFFELPREGYSVTEEADHLIYKHGKTTCQVKTLPAQQIPSLQALGPRMKITEQPAFLSVAASLCRNNAPDFTQAAWWVDGKIFSMLGHALCFSSDGLPEDHETFGLPSDAMAALAKIKSPLTFFTKDRVAVQFEFEDGTWLASRYFDGRDELTKPPDFMIAFVNKGETEEITFSPEAVEEIHAFKLTEEWQGQAVDMVWAGSEGTLTSRMGDEEIILRDAYTGGRDFKIKGDSLRTVLTLKPETLELVGRSGYASSLNGYGEGFAVAACLHR